MMRFTLTFFKAFYVIKLYNFFMLYNSFYFYYYFTKLKGQSLNQFYIFLVTNFLSIKTKIQFAFKFHDHLFFIVLHIINSFTLSLHSVHFINMINLIHLLNDEHAHAHLHLTRYILLN